MTKIAHFEGIDCANCAAKLEDKLNKIKGVDASISFVSKKMILDIENENQLLEIEKVCKKMEPEMEIVYE